MDPAAVPAGVRLGEVIAGKYRVDRVLGVGGMAVVVAAYHVELHEQVALKFLLPFALTSREAVERFVREARASVRIKSEHVARVIDVGKLDDGAPYIVMEYLDGSDLASVLVERGPLPVEQAVDVVLQTCEALAEAHTLGIVHRDLKPANLFSLKRAHGQHLIKVLDFGISKAIADTAMSVTRSGAIIGTPAYMSPEQIHSSGGVDMRTDIWSLGVILYELLTGKTPFTGDTIPELAMRITYEPPAEIRADRDIPDGIAQVITRCLDKDRDERFQTVGELALALKSFGPRHARRSVERVLATLMASGLSPIGVLPESAKMLIVARDEVTPVPAAPPPARALHRNKVAAAVAGLLLGAVIAAIFLVSRSGPSSAATDPSASSALAAEALLAAQRAGPSSSVSAEPAPTLTPIASAESAPVTATAPRPTARAGPNPGRPGPTPPLASETPAVNPNCRPPFYIDAAGHRQYKPECL